ncbi:MAG TPA: Holliday junction resolvase RuvX [Candidatus Acidoferrales bacterium]|nr:Holliday junction resolvase RuvX [Candidatus Acidoferrales bacterium]
MPTPLRALSIAADPANPGVILAIDYGKKRLGLALSDEFGITSRPFATWTRINRRRDLARLRELVGKEKIRRIIVGLPLHLNGAPSEMSEEARGFGLRVEKAIGIPVEMVDERLSSWEALETIARRDSGRRFRSAAGRNESKKVNAIDDVAAAIILRDYLDRARTRAGARA